MTATGTAPVREVREVEVPVLVVGGGGAGLTASNLLGQLGIDSLLVERHPSTSIHPKAVGLNQRTVEVLRSLGLEQDVAEVAAPPHTYERTAWYTSLGGDEPHHARRLGVRDAWGGGRFAPAYRAASPSRYTMLAQIRLEPVLREAAEQHASSDLRFGHELVDLDVREDHAVATITTDDGGTLRVTARYVIAADAGRTVAALAGIGESGPRDLIDMVSAHVRADLDAYVPDGGVLINWFVDPERGGSIGSGYLYHLGPYDRLGTSQEWVFAFAFAADDPARFDLETTPERIRTSLGLPELELEVVSLSHWYIQAVVADRFREGPVFLVGDAAHRIPPWGALGLNTAVQDVHNLVWKIAQVLDGDAAPSLLDTYAAEREPVARRVADRSLENFTNHAGVVDAAIGLAPDMPAARGREVVAELFADSPEGEQRRTAVQTAIDELDLEFYAHQAEIGFWYDDGAVVPDGTPPPAPVDQVCEYVPSTRPGHHLPHAWVRTGGGLVSTLDLVAPGRWTLLLGPDDAAWREQADAAASTGLPLDVVAVGPGRDAEDPDGRWTSLRGVGPAGAVLVRPDWHVAWRSTGPPDGDAELTDAVAALVGRTG